MTSARILPLIVLRSAPPPPVLTSIDYDILDPAGGDTATLTGTNLSGATAVTIDRGGGNQATGTITGNTPTTVTFTSPAITGGTYNIDVQTGGGVSNTLSAEWWYPGTESGCTMLWEAFATGSSSFTGTDGSSVAWTARKGTNISNGSNGVPSSPTGGSPGVPNPGGASSSSARITTGIVQSSLFGGSGVMGVIMSVDSALSSAGANVYDNSTMLMDQTSHTYGLVANTGGWTYYINSSLGVALGHPLFATPPVDGAYHLYLTRFVTTSNFDGQFDGKKTDGTAGWSSTSLGSQSLQPNTSNGVAFGNNYNNTKKWPGKLKAIWFFNTTISDAVGLKTLKWSRVRHGTP